MSTMSTVTAIAAVSFALFHSALAETGWTSAPVPSDHGPVSFNVALQPANQSAVDNLVHELSDPEGARYGQYLTGAQVKTKKRTP